MDIEILANMPLNSKFNELHLPSLGLGTIWIGRRWPANNENYIDPSISEISDYLNLAYSSSIRMFDTAAAYGLSEKRVGEYFRENSKMLDDIFIATKWGEDFDCVTEKSNVDHSLSNLKLSFERSAKFLPKIDLLYIHKADTKVLSDRDVKGQMLQYVLDGKIKYIGASISDGVELKKVIDNNLLWFNFLQTAANTARENPELIEYCFKKGIATVVNSPVRKLSGGMTPKDSYIDLIKNPYVSIILTGTRTHLKETLSYFGTRYQD